MWLMGPNPKVTIPTSVSVLLTRNVLLNCASLTSAWLTAQPLNYSMMDVLALLIVNAQLAIAITSSALLTAKDHLP